MLSRKNISLSYLPDFSLIKSFTFFNLKNLHSATGSMANFFLKRGNGKYPRIIKSNFFLALFFSAKLRSAKIKHRHFVNANVVFNGLERARAFTRLLNKFIRNRVRKVPTGLRVVYQRRRVLRQLSLVVRGKRKHIDRLLFNELSLILRNSSTSKVFAARDVIHKQSEAAKIYLRKKRFKKKVKKINYYLKKKKARRKKAKRIFRLKTVGVLRVRKNKNLSTKWKSFKRNFVYFIRTCKFYKRKFPGKSFGLLKAIRFNFSIKPKKTRRNRRWLPSYLFRQKKRMKKLRKKLFTFKLWRTLLTQLIYFKLGIERS